MLFRDAAGIAFFKRLILFIIHVANVVCVLPGKRPSIVTAPAEEPNEEKSEEQKEEELPDKKEWDKVKRCSQQGASDHGF